MTTTIKTTGTKTTMTTKFRKAGIICKYEVYEAACGGIFTARLTHYGSLATPEATWSEPQDTAIAACKAAYAEWQRPIAEAVEKSQEYHRSGGY